MLNATLKITFKHKNIIKYVNKVLYVKFPQQIASSPVCSIYPFQDNFQFLTGY